jgi:hypothetical protein
MEYMVAISVLLGGDSEVEIASIRDGNVGFLLNSGFDLELRIFLARILF